jgi:hypothetical protein
MQDVLVYADVLMQMIVKMVIASPCELLARFFRSDSESVGPLPWRKQSWWEKRKWRKRLTRLGVNTRWNGRLLKAASKFLWNLPPRNAGKRGGANYRVECIQASAMGSKFGHPASLGLSFSSHILVIEWTGLTKYSNCKHATYEGSCSKTGIRSGSADILVCCSGCGRMLTWTIGWYCVLSHLKQISTQKKRASKQSFFWGAMIESLRKVSSTKAGFHWQNRAKRKFLRGGDQ